MARTTTEVLGERITRLQNKVNRLENEAKRLRAENAELKKALEYWEDLELDYAELEVV